MKKSDIVFMLYFLSISYISIAQSFSIGSWNVLNTKYNFNETWSVFQESQVRSILLYSDYNYSEIKGGIN